MRFSYRLRKSLLTVLLTNKKSMIIGIIPPRANAIVWTDQQGDTLVHQRNHAVLVGKTIGMAEWEKQQ